MQSKAPSVTGDAKRWQKTRATSGFAIQCQAQGHPVPMFRYIHFPLPFERECCCRRAVGSEGAEILERRPRELVRSRRGRIVDVALPSPRVPSSVVQVKETKDSSFESPSIARTLRSRARGIQGARLPERRQKRHLRESSEILGRDHLRRSGIASPDSQVILLLSPFSFSACSRGGAYVRGTRARSHLSFCLFVEKSRLVGCRPSFQSLQSRTRSRWRAEPCSVCCATPRRSPVPRSGQ